MNKTTNLFSFWHEKLKVIMHPIFWLHHVMWYQLRVITLGFIWLECNDMFFLKEPQQQGKLQNLIQESLFDYAKVEGRKTLVLIGVLPCAKHEYLDSFDRACGGQYLVYSREDLILGGPTVYPSWEQLLVVVVSCLCVRLLASLASGLYLFCLCLTMNFVSFVPIKEKEKDQLFLHMSKRRAKTT